MSSSSISATTVNGVTRITGLSSGIDVDSIVEQLMTAEKAKKLNQLDKKVQLAEWKQTAYRSIISDIQAFADKYFNTASASSLLSSKNFNKYTVTSSNSAVTASYTSAASAGSHSVTVSQLAANASMSSSASISKDVQGGAAASYDGLSGKSIIVTVDGEQHTASLSNVTDLDSLQSAIDNAVGEGMLTVGTNSSGYLTITAKDRGVGSIALSASGTSGLSDLGFGSSNGAILSNRLDTSATLATIAGQLNSSTALAFNSEGKIALTINGTSFTFDEDTTLAKMMSEINSSGCRATMAYNSSTGKLTLTADQTGAGDTLVVTENADDEGVTSNFLAVCLDTTTAGKNARVTIDGVDYTRTSNTFTVDGVTYTLNATTGTDEKATVSLTLDGDGIYDLISNFVSDYNALIDTITTALEEDYNPDYAPLTDEQKESMTDEEITKWETKAKTGILEHDTLLTSFLRELRTAVSDSISGLATGIFDIGIDTGSYEENGKLTIDEDSLKEAIRSDPEAVMNLFIRQSSSYSGLATVRTLSSSALSTRYKKEGIAYRFYDVIAKYTSSLTDSSGNKGLLLEKAGITGDRSNTDNALSNAISSYESKIAAEEDRLDKYQEKLYSKYTTLETYINTMNAQLSALSSYLSDS